MNRVFLSLVLVLFIHVVQARTFNILELGADATGKQLCTELINKSIEQAANEGGGTLYFPAGEYLTGAIHLKSNITLHIETGAKINFSDHFDDYLPFVDLRWEGTFMKSLSPLIYAKGEKNIVIKGGGILDGKGHKWWQESRRIINEINEKGKVETLNELQKKWVEANKEVKVSAYYQKTMERKFFRPPFIQFLECENITLSGITILNSPFWTINPIGCDNIVVQGVTINNPSSNPKGHNTDGINPSSCRNVRISDCFISVGDDCITLKSGRDEDGRRYGRPCENITITNCIMLAGHGGVVIGSEMSGGVKKVTISNCVFNGTDAGIRLKASRGRGGVVEEIRVNNIIMNDIQRNAFIFDLFYDRESAVEPVSERTPIFRNIHISNVTGTNIKKIGYITGIEEMPIDEISFTDLNMQGEYGFSVEKGSNLVFQNVDFSATKESPFSFLNSEHIILDNIRSKYPLSQHPVVTFENTNNVLINNCFQVSKTDVFSSSVNSNIIWGQNYMNNVRTKEK